MAKAAPTVGDVRRRLNALTIGEQAGVYPRPLRELRKPGSLPAPEYIIELACKEFACTPERLRRQKDNNQVVNMPRAFAAALLDQMGYGYDAIRAALARKGEETINTYLGRHMDYLQMSQAYSQAYRRAMVLLRAQARGYTAPEVLQRRINDALCRWCAQPSQYEEVCTELDAIAREAAALLDDARHESSPVYQAVFMAAVATLDFIKRGAQ